MATNKNSGSNIVKINKQKKLERLGNAYEALVQKRLDDFAKTGGYDSILTAISYASSKVIRFKRDGEYALDARDNTLVIFYNIIRDVKRDLRPLPTFEQLANELPVLQWPSE